VVLNSRSPSFFLRHFNSVNYEVRRASQLNRNISHLFASPKRTRKEKQLNFLFKQDVDIVTNEAITKYSLVR
jgi:hypothetical protein